MQANAERGIAPRGFRSFFRGGFIDHQAGLRDEARTVGALDGGIDLRAAAEVVGGDDEVFQLAGRAGKVIPAAMTIWPLPHTPRKA